MKKYILFLLVSFMGIITVFGQQSSWKTKDGWVYRKEAGSSSYKPFFAIGIWNIPGYQPTAMNCTDDVYRKKSRSFLNNTDLYNMVYMNPGSDKDAYSRVEIVGSIPFYDMLFTYQKSLNGVSLDDPYWQYKARRHMKYHAKDKRFEVMLDSVIADVVRRDGPVDHVWAPIDEIVQGGSGASWTWYPETGEKIKERIKKQEPNTLVYTDLAGMPRGNYYLFEKRYLKTHKSLPSGQPPFEVLSKGTKILPSCPTYGFFQGYDGRPSYINGTEDYTPFSEVELVDLIYNNMKICAKDYRKCGDVFGLNCFYDTNRHPILSGISVDGIRAGLGKDRPVWLFFDGNGWSRPEDESVETFVQNLKCQMYTSIIHGATGIMFWNDRDKSPAVFNELNKVVRELTDHLNVVHLKTIRSYSSGYLNYLIKGNKKERYIIATNTSLKESVNLRIEGLNRILKPLEVYFAAY